MTRARLCYSSLERTITSSLLLWRGPTIIGSGAQRRSPALRSFRGAHTWSLSKMGGSASLNLRCPGCNNSYQLVQSGMRTDGRRRRWPRWPRLAAAALGPVVNYCKGTRNASPGRNGGHHAMAADRWRAEGANCSQTIARLGARWSGADWARKACSTACAYAIIRRHSLRRFSVSRYTRSARPRRSSPTSRRLSRAAWHEFSALL